MPFLENQNRFKLQNTANNKKRLSSFCILDESSKNILKPIAKENQIRKTGVVGQNSAQQYEDNKTRSKIAKASKVSHDTVARVELNLRKEDILRPIAKENQLKGVRLNSDEGIDTIGRIASDSKVARDTAYRVKFIRDNATEEIKQKLRSGNKDLSINKVYTDLKKKEQRKEAIIKANKVEPLETIKKYSIIYADPPWKYFESGNHNQSLHYNTMTIEEIKNLPVKELSKEDCILFLWVTFPILKDAFEVIESWGFSYSTCGFNWIKKNKRGEGWFFGLGS